MNARQELQQLQGYVCWLMSDQGCSCAIVWLSLSDQAEESNCWCRNGAGRTAASSLCAESYHDYGLLSSLLMTLVAAAQNNANNEGSVVVETHLLNIFRACKGCMQIWLWHP